MRILVVFLLLLAGCTGTVDETADGIVEEEPEIWKAPDWAIDALANQQGHDHANWTHHAGRTTPNFEVLGHDALATENAGGSSGGYLCGEVGEDLDGRSIAVTQSHYDEVALVVADVTNATAPEMLAELVLEGFSTYDAAITDDARYALIAVSSASPTAILNTVDARVGWRNDCGTSMGPMVALLPQPSVLLVDLSEPSQPEIVDQALFPGVGVHSVSEATIDGTYYVAATSVGFAAAATLFNFYTIEESELGASLMVYGSYNGANVQSRDGSVAVTNSHTDATIQKHPQTGQLLAYLADWSGGMIVVELVERGVIDWKSTWGGGILGEDFAVHSTLPLPETWDDRHITIVGEETITPRTGVPTGLVFVIDTTDPAAPEEVARWTLPTDAGGWDAALIYSPHYAAVVNHTVFVSMYHGGVWAFDAAPEHWPYPPSTGVYIPSESHAEAAAPQGSWAVMGYAPVLSEVITKSDGTLISFDSRGGVYTYRYEESPYVEPVASWFED